MAPSSSVCVAPGWGTGPYGTSPWGGGFGATPGGPIPSVAPFDIYCVGPCGPMSVILTYDEVDELGDGTQFTVNSELDEVLSSGGSAVTDDARLIITTSVPQTYTLDFTFRFDDLPPNFSNLVNEHIGIAVTDAAGPCAGLFFSQIGIAYVGGFHHDSGGNLVLDSTLQQLPNSQTMVSEGEYWSFRIAADLSTNAVFIYITRTSDLPTYGFQLRYVLPIIPATALAHPPTDRTAITVRGTPANLSVLAIDSICLGSGFVVPNIPPIADAGLDQASRTCAIIQLDGSRSSDPEGSPLTFSWRLIDAPLTSQFIFSGLDGQTFTVGSGFVNKFYSPSLADLDAEVAIAVGPRGDVLILGGEAFTIMSKGSDMSGFYVQVDGFVLPENLTLAPFKLMRQFGISGPTSIKPTFLPDEPGLYKFDLTVFDGQLYSDQSVTVVNVTENPVPRGCVPDLRFLWNYLSDFWRLVEDRERLEVFWGSVAQVAAAELLTLWQIDYSKSLRDVQRTFQRRWLHYDLLVSEPLPDVTTVRALYGGILSLNMDTPQPAAAGTTLVLSSPVFVEDIEITFSSFATLMPAELVSEINAVTSGIEPRLVARLIENKSPPGPAGQHIRLEAPFPFTISPDSTVPETIFTRGAKNQLPSGTGAGVGLKTYLVNQSLALLGIQADDLLILDGVGYRISHLVDSPLDFFSFQRIVVFDELPAAPATTWQIAAKATSTVIDFYAGLFSAGDIANFEVLGSDDSITLVQCPVLGVAPSDPKSLAFDPDLIGVALADSSKQVVFFSGKRRTYIPIHELIVDIPLLQEHIKSKNDQAILRRNIDFFLEEVRGQNAVRFVTADSPDPDVWEYLEPPDRLWAEVSYIDNRSIIEQNFGIPAEFTLDDLAELPGNTDYLSAVRGLWYSYFKGPTIFALRAGTQILLGLPFAEEAGTIVEIRTDFSPTQGRILMRDTENQEVVRSYTFPVSLGMEVNPATNLPYQVGDTVHQFAPLVTGVEVLDYVKDPKWFEGYLNQGVFFEVEKFFKFLVRVDSAAFSLAALLFVKNFVLKIKPTYTYPLFVVQKKAADTEISVTDEVTNVAHLLLFDGALTQINRDNTLGSATMFDEPDPSPTAGSLYQHSGNWQSNYDQNWLEFPNEPVFPTSQSPVIWGFDKNLLAPEDNIVGRVSMDKSGGGPFVPAFDQVFAFDSEVFNAHTAVLHDAAITTVPAGDGILLYDSPVTASSGGTIDDIVLEIKGDPQGEPVDYTIEVTIGASTTSYPFTEGDYSPFVFHQAVAIPYLMGDQITVRLKHGDSDPRTPMWRQVVLQLGTSIAWTYDDTVPAAIYTVYRAL